MPADLSSPMQWDLKSDEPPRPVRLNPQAFCSVRLPESAMPKKINMAKAITSLTNQVGTLARDSIQRVTVLTTDGSDRPSGSLMGAQLRLTSPTFGALVRAISADQTVVTVVTGQRDMEGRESHRYMAKSLAQMAPQEQIELATFLARQLDSHGQDIAGGNTLVVNEKPGRAFVLSRGAAVVKQQAKHFQDLCEQTVERTHLHPEAAVPGWALCGLASGTSTGQIVNVAAARLLAGVNRFTINSMSSLVELAESWLRDSGCPRIDKVYIVSPYLSTAQAMRRAVLDSQSDIFAKAERFEFQDLALGWQPMATGLAAVADAARGREGILVMHTGAFPQVELLGLWPGRDSAEVQ